MRSGGGLIVSWGLVSIAERIGRWTCLEDVKMLMKLEDGSGIPRGATRSALAKLGVEGGKIALGGKIAKGGGIRLGFFFLPLLLFFLPILFFLLSPSDSG